MIATHGGITGGYGLYLRDGRPVFVYNYLALERITVESKERLPSGKVQLQLDVVYQGNAQEVGKGAAVTLSVNGKPVAQGQLSKTIPATISISEGFDIGEDVGSAVDFTYKLPFRFTGAIEKVMVALKPAGQ